MRNLLSIDILFFWLSSLPLQLYYVLLVHSISSSLPLFLSLSLSLSLSFSLSSVFPFSFFLFFLSLCKLSFLFLPLHIFFVFFFLGEFPCSVFDIVLKRITIRGSIVGTRKDMEEALSFASRGISLIDR